MTDDDDSWELSLAVETFMRDVRDATGKPADLILVVPNGTLGDGVDREMILTDYGKCLLLAGIGATPGEMEKQFDENAPQN